MFCMLSIVTSKTIGFHDFSPIFSLWPPGYQLWRSTLVWIDVITVVGARPWYHATKGHRCSYSGVVSLPMG